MCLHDGQAHVDVPWSRTSCPNKTCTAIFFVSQHAGQCGVVSPLSKEADIAVWDRDMYTISTSGLKDLKCEMTLFGGEVVYKSAGTPITVTTPAKEGVAPR